MSDLFASLIQRSHGATPALGPVPPAPFDLPVAAPWGEVEDWRIAAAPQPAPSHAEPARQAPPRVEVEGEAAVTWPPTPAPTARPPQPELRDMTPRMTPRDSPSPPIAPRVEPRVPDVVSIVTQVLAQANPSTQASPTAITAPSDPANRRQPAVPRAEPAQPAPLAAPPAPMFARNERPVAPAVEVRIGRIEVKAPGPPAPPRLPPPARPAAPRLAVTLHDYLARRQRT